jgi:hypothetical protein
LTVAVALRDSAHELAILVFSRTPADRQVAASAAQGMNVGGRYRWHCFVALLVIALSAVVV